MTKLDLHDCEITNLSINRPDKRVTLAISFPTTGKTANLVLEGVTRLYGTEIALQNVILDLTIYKLSEQRPCSSYCNKALRIDDHFINKNPDAKILYIEPSVGLELACCFTELKLIPH